MANVFLFKNFTFTREESGFTDASSLSNVLVILKLVFYSTIMLSSLVGNSLVLVVIFQNANNRMRCPSNYFIANVALCDLSMTLFNLLQAIVAIFTNDVWKIGGPLGLILCALCRLMWFASIDVSVLSLLAVAVDRFLLVFFPTKKLISNRVSFIIITSTWLAGLALNIPRVQGIRLFEFSNVRHCGTKYNQMEDFRSYTLAHFVIFIICPLITMVVLYSAIVVKLRSHITPGNPSSASQELRDRQNRKILVLVVTLVLLFALCWLPYWSGVLVCTYYNHCPPWPYHYVTTIMAYSNTALNPCAYAMFNENFRAEFKRFIKVIFVPKCLNLRRNQVIEINIEMACGQSIRMMSAAAPTRTLSLSRMMNFVS